MPPPPQGFQTEPTDARARQPPRADGVVPSASGEPAPDLVPARFLLHGLEESDEMNDERDQRPARNRDYPPIGPADQQQREQDHHGGIAACRDQPEPAVESTPYMDGTPETYEIGRAHV